MSEVNKEQGIDDLLEKAPEPWMRLATEGNDIPVKAIEAFQVTQGDVTTEGRLYYPEGEGPFPVMFFVHGGAFVGGFNLMDEPICRQMCHDVGCVVISPNYQLAPTYQWPHALNELYGLLHYFKDNAKTYHLDMNRLAVGGSSAGANYAAALCVKAYQEKSITFQYQVLIYPTTDLKGDREEKVNRLTDTNAMHPDGFKDLVACYVPEGIDPGNPLISPIYGPVEAFPKTCIFSGRLDLLWYEGKQFADKLIEGGVETLYKCYAEMGHGFMELAGWEYISRDVKKIICSELKRNL